MKKHFTILSLCVFMSLTFLFSCAYSDKESGGLTSETAVTAESPVTTPSVETEIPVTAQTTTKKQTPTISIKTEGRRPINSDTEYISATVSLEKSEGEDFKNYPAQIRGRGNSTWMYFDKKPYRLKFDFGVDLFGMGQNRDYVLLANAMDMSQFNNYAAFTLAQIFGLKYNFQCKFVNLVVNGQYEGLYLLTEQIEIGKNRIDIDDNGSKSVDTSYLVEFGGGGSKNEKHIFKMRPVIVGGEIHEWRKEFRGAVKYPDETVCTEKQLEFISNYVNEVNAAIFRKDFKRFCELCDLDSFVANVLVNEIALASDFDWNFYMFKEKGGKLYLGPVWDFAQGYGISTKNGSTFEGLTVSKFPCWITELLKMPEFYEAARKKWIECYDDIHALPDHLIEKSVELSEDIENNFLRHDVLGKPYWRQTPDTAEYVTYDEFLDRLVFWLDNRLIWLDDYFKVKK